RIGISEIASRLAGPGADVPGVAARDLGGSGGRVRLRSAGMDLTGLESNRAVLLGRERECAQIDRLLEGAAAGESGALVVRAAAERFLVSAAVLGLLAAAAEVRPVLCLIDDAQWLDRPSLDALVFTARRLGADRVAMIIAAREGEARRFDGGGLPELLLEGLD